MGKKATSAAFIAGAAVGAAAGLMSKKKNRQKLAKAAKKVKVQAKTTANKGLDKAKVVTTQVKSKIGKKEQKDSE